MPYEQEFYILENIIGYTGDLHTTPTVYFKNDNRFGRITQAHTDADNIGRSLVREYGDYQITNSAPNGAAEEYYDGEVQHTSRHLFISAAGQSRWQMILATSINNHTEAKPAYSK